MKLLFAHQHLGAMGGAEATLLLTASELKRRGHGVWLLYKSPTGKSENEWVSTFNGCFRLAGPGNTEHLEAAISEVNPDVLFINNLEDLATLKALLDTGLPSVRMVHDHALYCMRKYKYNYLTRAACTRPASGFCVFPCMATIARNRDGVLPVKLESFSEKLRELSLNRRCDKLIVYSEYCRQELVRNGFKEDKISTFVPIAPPPVNEPVSSLDSRNLVLFAGQIIRGKGVDILLRSLKHLKVPFECVVLGEGSHKSYCERLCRRLGLSGSVRFHGYVPHAELRKYYLQASVFAVSSVWPEPFGLVGPEAMRYGLPVVAFDVGGIREWLHDGENGFLVPWMDTRAYGRALERLLTDKQLARHLGQRGRDGVLRDYDLSTQVAKLESIFESLKAKAESTINENAGLNVVHGNR